MTVKPTLPLKRRRVVAALAVPAALLALSVPIAQAAPPAADEYGANFPDAKGKSTPGGSQPVAHPERLPASTARALAGDKEGQALVTAATATELGAPAGAVKASGAAGTGESATGGGADGSAFSAATDAAGSPTTLLLLIAAGALVVLGLVARRSARGRSV